MNSSSEGVIKFRAEHQPAPVDVPDAILGSLMGWRRVLYRLELIGQDPARYDGAGYGNISARLPGRGRFVVTGTQTGGVKELSARDFTVVGGCSIEENTVRSAGVLPPSSESMTHAAVYAAAFQVNVIFHVHSPVIWRSMRALQIPFTAEDVPYGTPQMAYEIRRLFREGQVRQTRVLGMAGHEDGIISFGASADEAGGVLVGMLARAHALGIVGR